MTIDGEPMSRTISETLARTLREQILTGVISPGSRLRQIDLANQFGVSTTPVREAFALLAKDGLVTLTAQRGAVVFEAKAEDLRHNYEIRIALECLAIEKSVPKLTADDLAVLRRLLDDDARTPDDDVAEHERINREFHARCYLRCGNPKLIKTIDELRSSTTAYLRIFAVQRPSSDVTQGQHEAILQACVRRAPKAASRALREHLQYTLDVVSDHLRRQRGSMDDGTGIDVA